MATASFTDVKEIGLKGPFNASRLTFRVFIDADGGLHFTSYHNNMASGRSPQTRTAQEVFTHLQPCCSKKREWKSEEDSNWYYRSSEASAATILRTRKAFLKATDLSGPLKEKSSSSATIFETLMNHYSVTESSLLAALSASGLEQTNWKQEYQKAHAKDLVKLVKLFKSTEQQSIINKFAKLAHNPFSQSIDPSIVKAKRKFNRELFVRLSNPANQYLATVPISASPMVNAIKALYATKEEPFLVLPLAIAEYFDFLSMSKASVKLIAPLEDSTLEGLKVLYDPAGDGAYADLGKAYRAALLL